MYQLIAAGVLFLVISVGIIGVIHSHDNKVRTVQKAADQDAITAAQTNTATCKAANVSLQASVDVIEQDRVKQNDAVLAWRQLADRAATVAQDNLNANKTTLAQLDATKRDAQAKSRRPAKAMTCEQTLNEIDNDSKQFAMEREARATLGLPEKSDAMRVK